MVVGDVRLDGLMLYAKSQTGLGLELLLTLTRTFTPPRYTTDIVELD